MSVPGAHARHHPALFGRGGRRRQGRALLGRTRRMLPERPGQERRGLQLRADAAGACAGALSAQGRAVGVQPGSAPM